MEQTELTVVGGIWIRLGNSELYQHREFVGNPSNCQLMNTIVERRIIYFSVFVCRSQGHTHILQEAGLLAIRKLELGEVYSYNKTN